MAMPHRPLWILLLTAASVAFSLGFACVTPFAAFAAAGALTLSRHDALWLTFFVWLANQVMGFTLMSYPWDASTLAWGVAIGFAAGFATVAAQFTNTLLRHKPFAARAVATICAAFAVLELQLFAVAAASGNGTEHYGVDVVGPLFAITLAVFVGLLGLHGLRRAAVVAVR